MSAIIASNIAISSASASINRERKELKTKNCVNLVQEFDNKTSSTQQKQEYAACVQHLHPTMSANDEIAFKAIAVVFLVSWLYSLGYLLYKNKYDYGSYGSYELILLPILFSAIVAFAMLFLAGAILVLLM